MISKVLGITSDCDGRSIPSKVNLTDNYSCSYAEDVTSVTSGTSQGPHSFNLVFVCLCNCVFVSRLALSRICPVPYRTIKHSWPHTAGCTIQIGLSNAKS